MRAHFLEDMFCTVLRGKKREKGGREIPVVTKDELFLKNAIIERRGHTRESHWSCWLSRLLGFKHQTKQLVFYFCWSSDAFWSLELACVELSWNIGLGFITQNGQVLEYWVGVDLNPRVEKSESHFKLCVGVYPAQRGGWSETPRTGFHMGWNMF